MTQSLGSKRVHLFSSSKAGVVNNPEPAVLLPGEIAQEMIFRVDVVAESLGAEESVYIAAIGELAKNLCRRLADLPKWRLRSIAESGEGLRK